MLKEHWVKGPVLSTAAAQVAAKGTSTGMAKKKKSEPLKKPSWVTVSQAGGIGPETEIGKHSISEKQKMEYEWWDGEGVGGEWRLGR